MGPGPKGRPWEGGPCIPLSKTHKFVPIIPDSARKCPGMPEALINSYETAVSTGKTFGVVASNVIVVEALAVVVIL